MALQQPGFAQQTLQVQLLQLSRLCKAAARADIRSAGFELLLRTTLKKSCRRALPAAGPQRNKHSNMAGDIAACRQAVALAHLFNVEKRVGDGGIAPLPHSHICFNLEIVHAHLDCGHLNADPARHYA